MRACRRGCSSRRTCGAGLLQNEFFLAYQPQIDLQTGRTGAVEALLRWRDPVRGVIPPTEFIPIAEESGMIQALGARVLRDACRQVVAWHRLGMMLRLSVNLSVQQLQHDSCLAVVEDALRASGLAPQYLDLEITESVIITHPEKAVATLAKLKERGISITVDDFGTGYSSLSYLARLPIEAVKIDQRFVHGLEHNSNDVAITQAIIALSHSLGLRVIAEGVETRAQFDFLKSHGCEAAQGFLIGRPLEEQDFLAWWKAQEQVSRAVQLQPDMWQPEGSAIEVRSNGYGEVRRSIDVAQRAGIVDVDSGEAVAMLRNDRFRTVVAGQRRQRGATGGAKAHRMPALPAVERSGHRRTVRDRLGDARDRGRLDPRHVAQGDDPAGGVRVASTPHARLAPIPESAFAQRTMRAPAAPSAAASAASSGRTTATTRGSTASRFRHAITPMHSPSRSVSAGRPAFAATPAFARSLSPPNRSPRPAASRMPDARRLRRHDARSRLHDLPFAVLHLEDRQQPCVRSPCASNAISAVTPL